MALASFFSAGLSIAAYASVPSAANVTPAASKSRMSFLFFILFQPHFPQTHAQTAAFKEALMK